MIGDLHLTDRAQDAHRFGIFDWIRRQQEKHPVAATFLAGDITDQKDRHSATLVNKIVGGLLKLQPPVYIVMGNHDYRDPKNPFFKFLSHIEGIQFVVKPMMVDIPSMQRPIVLIPHYRTQDEFDAAIKLSAWAQPAAFLVHQTFDGAIAESGVRLSGLSASLVESFKPPLGVYAGDVHRPQTQGQVIYLGCPYHIRFGDDFTPRVLWIAKNGQRVNRCFSAPYKWSLTVRDADDVLNDNQLREGDQIKLTIQITREEATEWKRIKQGVLDACKELKLEVFGAKVEVQTIQSIRLHLNEKHMGHVQILEQFCKVEKVSNTIKKVGMEILDGNKSVL